MFLNNYHQLKNKEICVLPFLILFSVIVRIPVALIYGDTSLEHEWGLLVNNLIKHGQLIYEIFDNGFLLPNLWMKMKIPTVLLARKLPKTILSLPLKAKL